MGVGKAIKWILLLPLILAGLGIAYCEANKAYWDHRVRGLCKKESDIKIFERVLLMREEYDAMKKVGSYFVPPKMSHFSNRRYKFYHDMENTIIQQSNPDIWAPSVGRTDVSIIRKSDSKVIAKYSRFYRIGGDFIIGILPDSHYWCSPILPGHDRQHFLNQGGLKMNTATDLFND
ncbi:MAG: hypothetical protein IPH83_06180 [Gammaproteobacteria bacterium]|nr:hypothetical protein [Gammaproteobacteria bacterium]